MSREPWCEEPSESFDDLARDLPTDPDEKPPPDGSVSEEWVLVERISPAGPKWFRKWVDIGPLCTYDPDQAARFPTEQAALASPAASFWLTFYKPERVDSRHGNSHARPE